LKIMIVKHLKRERKRNKIEKIKETKKELTIGEE